MAKIKKCGVCGKSKSITNYWKRSDNGKVRNTCKDCQRNQAAASRARK